MTIFRAALYGSRVRTAGWLLAATLLATALAGCDSTAGLTTAFEKAKDALVQRVRGKPPAQKKSRQSRPHLVELAEVRLDAFNLTHVYSGSLRARRTVRIHAQEEGRVTAVPFYEGDTVAGGEQILRIDATLLRAQLDKAVAVREESAANLKRLAGLRRSKLVGEDEYSRAVTALQVAKAEEVVLRARVGYTQVTAPFSGVVTQRHMEPGDIVARHAHIMTISDPDSLLIDIAASELLLPDLYTGDEVTVRIDALGSADYLGEVVRIHPQIDARTRQGKVEVALKPIPEGARAGQFARVTFSVTAFGRTVMPFGALRRDRSGEYVFVVAADGKARKVSVRTGRRLADRVEVLQGLEPGANVVLRGFLGLTDGKTVKAVNAPAA